MNDKFRRSQLKIIIYNVMETTIVQAERFLNHLDLPIDRFSRNFVS